MKSISEMREHLIEKASDSEEFRARLISEPKAVGFEEFGITMPENFNLHVMEDDAENSYLVLPPATRLTEEQLEGASGADYDLVSIREFICESAHFRVPVSSGVWAEWKKAAHAPVLTAIPPVT